jgi:outer membrane receptor protein involved in Fe transport
MTKFQHMKSLLGGTALVAVLVLPASGSELNIPGGDLKSALDTYARQTGTSLLYPENAVEGIHSAGAKGSLSPDEALSRILKGTGFKVRKHSDGTIMIVHEAAAANDAPPVIMLAAAETSVASRSVETVTVTSSKLGDADVQSVPIAITALSQEQLTAQQITGGPDLIKSVPNMSFTKTNFSGYSIQIRGIGTQAVSVTTDPAVAVSFNDTPFIRNHFFEQEFFDVQQVQVLRGPQGTLYGRNATAGVVNLVSAKPSDHYEAMASVDVGNYNGRRLEGMLNIPVMGDKLGIRLAGAWTKRDGYDYNTITEHNVNGRDLWSGRGTIGFAPTSWLRGDVVWEHFDEKDDRSRTGKQLCHRDPGPESIGAQQNLDTFARAELSQGCLPGSLYDAGAFGTPNGNSIPFVLAAEDKQLGRLGYMPHVAGSSGSRLDETVTLVGGSDPNRNPIDPYGGMMQVPDYRVISSGRDPKFKSKNDVVELNFDVDVTPSLTVTSQSGYNKDYYYSTQDYNRFNTVDIFNNSDGLEGFLQGSVNPAPIMPGGVYCDPQLGCSKSIMGVDISRAKSWQISQEIRTASHFEGPLNFSFGANYLHYKTQEDYFVLFNLITALAQAGSPNGNGSADITKCAVPKASTTYYDIGTPQAAGCIYIDPNPLESINGEGHNYFRSSNPYKLTSWAGFGEVYYQATPDLKLTGGLRYTSDTKTFTPIPTQLLLSTLLVNGGTVDRGYPADPDMVQHWGEFTGRFNAEWSPKLAFTDQTMVYASFAHGYKGGGANPPGIGFSGASFGVLGPYLQTLSYPLTFKPEFVNAYELGSKNMLGDGAVTLNAGLFFYDYKNYQISQIVSRTAINQNFDARVWGGEAEGTWEPIPGLRFNAAAGFQGSRVGDNQYSIDLMDRLNGHGDDYVVLKPFVLLPSNCVVKKSMVEQYVAYNRAHNRADGIALPSLCPGAAIANAGRIAGLTPDIRRNVDPDYPFNEDIFPNQGQGFAKDVGGNKLPNTPDFTLSAGAQYSMPLSEDWAGTLRGDFYWQGNSFARIYNDKPYDQLHGYTNINLALIFTNQDGWQTMVYVKNLADTTAITGTFLNSDDTALTTNIFTTDPRLFGIRITKNW